MLSKFLTLLLLTAYYVQVTGIFDVDSSLPDNVHFTVRPGWPTLQEIHGLEPTEPATATLGDVEVPVAFQLDVFQAEPDLRHVSLLLRLDPETRDVTAPLAVALNGDVDAGLRWVKELKPLTDWKALALQRITWNIFQANVLGPAGKRLEDIDPDDHEVLRPLDELIATLASTVVKRKRRNSITEELLAEVASVYREAISGGRPTQAVQEHFYVTHATAARYVRLARESGHLGPSRGTRGGEAATT